MTKAMTFAAVASKFSDEAAAWEYVEELRWNGKPVCPRCGCLEVTYLAPRDGEVRTTRTGEKSYRRVWSCRGCRKQFSVLIGTIFEGTKIPLRKWLMAIYLMSAGKNGCAALELQRDLQITYKSAWFMVHRIREALLHTAGGPKMFGVVVADETWVGGDPGNRHASKRTKAGRGRTDKTTVLSIADARTGEIRSEVVPNVRASTIAPIITTNVDRHNAILHTDAAQHYRTVGSRFIAHHTVDHSQGEYVRGDVTTNRVEGFFSQFKRSLDGTFHNVSAEHLERYAQEFDFRATTRKLSDGERGTEVVALTAGRHITYRSLIARGPIAMGTRPRPVGRPGPR